MELDIAAAGAAAAQIAAGEVAVGQLDLEYIVPARLALIADAHSAGPRYPVNGDVEVNDPAIRIIRINGVDRHGGILDVLAIAMVYVIQVAPEGAFLDAAGDAEVAIRAGGGAGNPPATRHEVLWRRNEAPIGSGDKNGQHNS